MTQIEIKRRFYATLHITHPTMDPAICTRGLRLRPWGSHKAMVGRPRVTPTGRRLEGTFPLSGWSHRFEAARKATDLYTFLPQVLRKLEPHRAFLRKLVREKGTLELFCGVIADGNWDESFSPELLGRFAVLNLALRLDVWPERRPVAGRTRRHSTLKR